MLAEESVAHKLNAWLNVPSTVNKISMMSVVTCSDNTSIIVLNIYLSQTCAALCFAIIGHVLYNVLKHMVCIVFYN